MSVVHFAPLPPTSFPSYSSLTLADSTSLDDALRLILPSLHRPLSTLPPLSVLLHSRLGGGPIDLTTLRRLTDHDWRALDGVPAMARVHLKRLARQSKRGTPLAYVTSPTSAAASPSSSPSSTTEPWLQELQAEWQLPAPLDLSLYAASLASLSSMGFARREALEALLVTENKGADVAVNFLFADQAARAKRREDAKAKLRAAAAAAVSSSSPRSPGPLASPTSGADRILLYREFLRGCIAEGRVGTVAWDVIRAEREKRKVSKAEHAQVLKDCGVSEDKWEGWRKTRTRTGGSGGGGGGGGGIDTVDLDCVVCLDERKDQVCRPCGHLCMCAGCAGAMLKAKGKKAKCPLCEHDIDEIMKIYI